MLNMISLIIRFQGLIEVLYYHQLIFQETIKQPIKHKITLNINGVVTNHKIAIVLLKVY